MNTLRKVCLLIALMLGAGLPGFAATVSGTFTTTGVSTGLFVKAGERARVQLLGTFVATVQLQMSTDGGNSYRRVENYTSTVAVTLAARTNDVRYRVSATAYTSGTVTYALDNVVATTGSGRNKFSTVPIGSVAYGSFGSVLAPPVIGTVYLTDLVIDRAMTVSGIGILNGATCGTDKYILWLFDASGLALGSTDLAGTTCSGTDAFQEIALTQAVAVQAGKFHIGVRVNGTTDRTRFIATNTFIDNLTSATAHSSTVVGSFGSTIFAISVPSTFTAGQGPIAYVYGN